MNCRSFGFYDGVEIFAYTLICGKLSAEVITYGSALRTLCVPDKNGHPVDVVLGYDDLDGYLCNEGCLGALIGRFGNRIEHGTFTLNGETYHIPATDNGNALHGGLRGFDKRVWQATPLSDCELLLTYLSADGEEGFPGNLTISVRYLLTEDGISISYSAVSDKDTVLNLTNHSYFNLNESGDILGHTLMLAADAITPVDEKLIPHGGVCAVADGPFDFRVAKPIGRDIAADDIYIRYCNGYDTNFVLSGEGWRKFCTCVGEKSGIVMEGYTDRPGVQFYTGGFLDGQVGKGGARYLPASGFCLETQTFPNAVNCPDYPSAVLRAGDVFESVTAFRFSAV